MPPIPLTITGCSGVNVVLQRNTAYTLLHCIRAGMCILTLAAPCRRVLPSQMLLWAHLLLTLCISVPRSVYHRYTPVMGTDAHSVHPIASAIPLPPPQENLLALRLTLQRKFLHRNRFKTIISQPIKMKNILHSLKRLQKNII